VMPWDVYFQRVHNCYVVNRSFSQPVLVRRALWSISASRSGRAHAVICIWDAKRSLRDLVLILFPEVPNIHHHHHHNITFRLGLFMIDHSVLADRRTRPVLLRCIVYYSCVRHVFVRIWLSISSCFFLLHILASQPSTTLLS